jgi:hypothetical protein
VASGEISGSRRLTAEFNHLQKPATSCLKIAESLANSQLPLNHTAFEAPVDTAAWRDKPTFYVISTKDKVIAPEVQRIFATRMHAQTTEVAGSHASLVVHSKEVAAVIEQAALAE